MAKSGYSLHIGINSVDSGHYQDWEGKLYLSEKDAEAMLVIAKAENYISSEILLTKEATSKKLIELIGKYVKSAKAGDIVTGQTNLEFDRQNPISI